jgi:hypothetical protein
LYELKKVETIADLALQVLRSPTLPILKMVQHA